MFLSHTHWYYIRSKRAGYVAPILKWPPKTIIPQLGDGVCTHVCAGSQQVGHQLLLQACYLRGSWSLREAEELEGSDGFLWGAELRQEGLRERFVPFLYHSGLFNHLTKLTNLRNWQPLLWVLRQRAHRTGKAWPTWGAGLTRTRIPRNGWGGSLESESVNDPSLLLCWTL